MSRHEPLRTAGFEPPSPADEEANDGLPAPLAELGVSPQRDPIPTPAPSLAPLGLARLASVDADGKIEIRVSDRIVPATLDPTVHVAVIRTAEERGEPVLVEQRDGSFFVVGALRTQPTPGVDKTTHVVIEAETIELKAKEEVLVTNGVAAIALRALGEVETYADRIVSRAETVHKIIGRMLRLN